MTVSSGMGSDLDTLSSGVPFAPSEKEYNVPHVHKHAKTNYIWHSDYCFGCTHCLTL